MPLIRLRSGLRVGRAFPSSYATCWLRNGVKMRGPISSIRTGDVCAAERDEREILTLVPVTAIEQMKTEGVPS